MKIKFKILLLALLATSASGFAASLKDRFTYYPSEFYSRVERGESGAELRADLFSILSSWHKINAGGNDDVAANCPTGAVCYRHTALGYNPARKILFGELHLEAYGSGFAIRDVYCQHLSTPSDYKHNPPGPGQIPDASVMNTEHTWPQSRFSGQFPKELQKSDLHILYPTLNGANSSRSNNKFNEVTSEISSPCPLSHRGYGASGSKEIYFEPPEVHKGNVARAVLYFSVRYNLPVDPEEEASLRAWHHMDPADDFERARAEAIFAKQKVRNPFIDHPELVDLIADF